MPSTQPTGQVVAQAPTSGTNAPANSNVRLNVSSGPSTTAVTVPDVRGEDEKTARHDLQEAGFKVDVVRQDVTDESQNRVVIDQSPKPDEPTPAGSNVTIVVGRSNTSTTRPAAPVTRLHWCRASLRPPEGGAGAACARSSSSSTRSTSSTTATGSTTCSPSTASPPPAPSSPAPVRRARRCGSCCTRTTGSRSRATPTPRSGRPPAARGFTLDLERPELVADAPGVDGLIGRVLATAYARDGRRHVDAAEGLPQPRLPLGVLRLLQEQIGDLVLDAAVREPDEDPVVPPSARNSLTLLSIRASL